MSQNKIFFLSEGDAWYERNAEYLQTTEQASTLRDVSYICDVLHPFKSQVNQILEIGCSNGIKLETICHHLDSVGFGIDSSSCAVNSGNARKKISDIKLRVGDGSKLPFESLSFDLVYFAFCLYLFDRETLMQSIAEADRVLKPGGFLVITDFDPGHNYKRAYDHCEGVFSYKQDYANFYTQSGLYYLAGKNCFSNKSIFFEELSDERVSTSILYKELNPYPMVGR
jgi:ubiquinone/menaquinone biosynthesis C-methylase UbiE